MSEIKRYTSRDNNGIVNSLTQEIWNGLTSEEGEAIQELAEKLCQYEETGLTPDQISKIQSLNMLRDEVHQNAVNKGWWDKPREFGTLCALIHSEVSEALEEHRNGKDENMSYVSFDNNGIEKIEGIPSELADIIIRVLDICGFHDIDIELIIRKKMKYNASREHKHGGKVC